ncbi:GGDEF domain-containing protein [Demequina lignilytica]|uniref:GGDEF domain-containing protein n=1 Tax=Demequina lignilytica TaxID=3051663 RepID=A0AB35MG80_9MICO|nr:MULTISPECIES: GGDEF domain-containing protein [unclassified Demequina]MDN4482746.1 GGDEF domain-containing protein [Demequina sp. SYSU T0a273]MDN4490078.1 GGDEF domain-containing protein [Demequina sp. SYSU T00068]
MGLRASVGRAWVVSTTVGVVGLPRDAARAVLGANHFFVLASVVAVPWTVTFALHSSSSQPYPAVTHSLLILTWMLCLWMNARGLHVLAPALGLAAALVQYGYLTHLYGRDSAFQLAMLSVPTLSFVMFEQHRRAMRLTSTAIVGAAVAFVYLDPRFAEPMVEVSRTWTQAVAVGNVFSALAIFATVALYNDLYLRQERSRADRLLDEAQRAADTDSLTGLLNRRGVAPLLAAAPEEGAYALLLIDVDRFKSVNDRLGHAEGDRVLAKVAAVLAACGRPDASLARWGGEEFLMVVPDAWPGRVRRLAESLRRDVEDELAMDGAPGVTVSVGAAFAIRGVPFEDTLRIADACLYEAKESGRNVSIAREVVA